MTASPLKIDGAELRLVRLPLLTPFTIATGTMHEKLFPLLTLRSNGIEGHAEGVMDPLPDYLDETIAGAMMLLRDVLIARIEKDKVLRADGGNRIEFVQRDGGVYIQSESITLTRGIPTGVGWLVRPFVTSIPRDSLTFTLETTRTRLRGRT